MPRIKNKDFFKRLGAQGKATIRASSWGPNFCSIYRVDLI